MNDLITILLYHAKTKDEEVTLIIPATRGLTGLKDQKECAIKFLDIVKKINN